VIRILGWGTVFISFAASGFLAHRLLSPLPRTDGAGDPVHHVSGPAGPTIEQVQKLANLVTLRVPISDVQVSRLEGFTGGLRVAIAVHGDVEIATDLSTARFEDVDHAQRSAVLVLPRPVTVRPRLDHEKTRVIEYQRSGLWWWVNGQAGEDVLTSRAMTHAQRLLAATANREELLAQACEHTQAVIRAFFSAMDWDVAVRWEQPTQQAAR